MWSDWDFVSDSNGSKKVNGLVIGVALAALGVGGGGIGILGNQSTADKDMAALRVEIAAVKADTADEIAALKAAAADEEKRMIALVQAADDDAADRFRRGRLAADVEMKLLEDKVHRLELIQAQSGRD